MLLVKGTSSVVDKVNKEENIVAKRESKMTKIIEKDPFFDSCSRRVVIIVSSITQKSFNNFLLENSDRWKYSSYMKAQSREGMKTKLKLTSKVIKTKKEALLKRCKRDGIQTVTVRPTVKLFPEHSVSTASSDKNTFSVSSLREEGKRTKSEILVSRTAVWRMKEENGIQSDALRMKRFEGRSEREDREKIEVNFVKNSNPAWCPRNYFFHHRCIFFKIHSLIRLS